jgi:hypothetical protein
MKDNILTFEKIRAMAEEAGLTALTEAQLRQLERVTNAKRAKPLGLPFAELTPADEPASAFRPVESDVPHKGEAT